MTTTILIISLFFVFGLILGLVAFYFFYKSTAKSSKPVAVPKKAAAYNLAFKWSYIMLPTALLLLAVVLCAIFYPQLTKEVAFRFEIDGSPKSWLSREAVTSITLIPQFILAPLAAAVALGIIKLSRSSEQAADTINPEKLILFMCNMVALPQVIIGFVMLDIFSYNVYNQHLMPLWMFAIIAMVVASVILAIFFIQTIKKSRQGG